MKKSILHFILFGLLCSRTEDITLTTGELSGSVSDKTTGEPVATVNVTLTPGGRSTVTGSDGAFQFSNLEGGNYVIEIDKEGYHNNSKSIYVTGGTNTSAHLLIERIPAMVTADRDTLDFGSKYGTNTLSFSIVNNTYEDLDWSIEENSPWITEIKPSNGILKYGKTETIVVLIDREKLEEGLNESVIIVRSSNGRAEITAIAKNGVTEGDGYIILTAAGLAVQTSDLGTGSHGTAKSICEHSTIGNYTNWRLPTEDELMTLYTNKELIGGFSNTYYWSSNYYTSAGFYEYYETINFEDGSKESLRTDNKIQIRAVRSISLLQVATQEAVDVDFANGIATLQGTIIDIGEPAYTERGFVWSTQPEPTIYDNVIVAKGSAVEGLYRAYTTSLPKGEKCHVRAYATNSAGTTYGEEILIQPEYIELSTAGLAVQTKDLGCVGWTSANSMCENSIVGGYTDWRLPNKDELMTIYANKELIGGFKEKTYWSSSYFYNSRYYYIDFQTGNLDNFYSSSCNFYVRAVRTLTTE